MAGYNQCDAATLAAAYAFGLVRNHPFIDGHKRVAWTTARTFLLLHGHDVQASDTDKVLKVLALADGALSEAEFADWLRRGLTPI
jgi:death-on-curing protein